MSIVVFALDRRGQEGLIEFGRGWSRWTNAGLCSWLKMPIERCQLKHGNAEYGGREHPASFSNFDQIPNLGKAVDPYFHMPRTPSSFAFAGECLSC